MTHRRRRRLELPAPPAQPAGAESAVCRVLAIYDDASAGAEMAQIEEQIQHTDAAVAFTEDEAALATADRVLLFLSAGVLAAGGEPLRQLMEVLQLDQESGLGENTRNSDPLLHVDTFI